MPSAPFFKSLLLTGLLFSCALHAQTKVVAYVPNWIDLKTFAPQIDYAKLTHINIAFENPADAAGALSFHEENDLLIRQAHEHGVKILISLGGGSASEKKPMRERWFDLISAAKRAGFVARLAEYASAHDLDGLDIDLEGPAINRDYGAFIQELSAALKLKNKLLTAALSKGYGGKECPRLRWRASTSSTSWPTTPPAPGSRRSPARIHQWSLPRPMWTTGSSAVCPKQNSSSASPSTAGALARPSARESIGMPS